MLKWAWKSLISQRGTLVGSALGIAGAFLLVILFGAVFRGESSQIVAYPTNIKPDVWVMQRGVGNMHMAMSFVWDWKADRIAAMDDVKLVTPILYQATVVRMRDWESFAFIVGLLPESKNRAGPWKIAAGREIENSGEAVIPDVLSDLTGIGIGESIAITDRNFKVVGLSAGTFSSANPIIFVPFSSLEDIMSSAGTYSYLLVDAEEDVDPRALAERIRREVPKVNALLHEEFIKNDFQMAMQMGVEIIFMMTVICSGLAALIVGFTTYSLVMRNRRELAIVKALGGTQFICFIQRSLPVRHSDLARFFICCSFRTCYYSLYSITRAAAYIGCFFQCSCAHRPGGIAGRDTWFADPRVYGIAPGSGHSISYIRRTVWNHQY